MRIRRTGFSLLEMVLVIALVAFTLSFGGVLVVGATRSDRVAVEGVTRITQHGRLSEQFRDDVAAARTVRQLDENQMVLEWPAGGSVVYTPRPEGLIRIAIAADGSTQRQFLPLGAPQARCKFTHTGRLVRLHVTEYRDSMPGLTITVTGLLGG